QNRKPSGRAFGDADGRGGNREVPRRSRQLYGGDVASGLRNRECAGDRPRRRSRNGAERDGDHARSSTRRNNNWECAAIASGGAGSKYSRRGGDRRNAER